MTYKEYFSGMSNEEAIFAQWENLRKRSCYKCSLSIRDNNGSLKCCDRVSEQMCRGDFDAWLDKEMTK